MFRITVCCSYCIRSLEWNVPTMAPIDKDELMDTMLNLGWKLKPEVLCSECAEQYSEMLGKSWDKEGCEE